MSGDIDAIERLWLLKRGEIEEDDLSDVIPVQLGAATELLNTDLFELHTGYRVANEQDRPAYGSWPIAQSTLDGLVYRSDAAFDAGEKPLGVFEAKFQLPFSWSMKASVKKYQWQLVHNCLTTGTDYAWLSVITGAGQYTYQQVAVDPFAKAELLEVEQTFWSCVTEGRYPLLRYCTHNNDLVITNVYTNEIVEMHENEAWRELAAQAVASHKSAQVFDNAKKRIKAMMPKTAKIAHGAGVTLSRSKANRVSLDIWPK